MGEITVILLLALIFLGPGKLPDLAAGLGKLIKEIRKATSDVKNEIALDDSFRKPFEELRDAVTLHPDELKRRDEIRKFHEEAAKRAAEEAAQAAQASAGGGEAPAGEGAPPHGLASPVNTIGVSQPGPNGTLVPPPAPLPPEAPAGPNDTIVQMAPPHHATLDDIPTPPPETPLPPAKPPGAPRGATPPLGTIARPNTLRGVKPVPAAAPPPPPPAAPSAPANGES